MPARSRKGVSEDQHIADPCYLWWRNLTHVWLEGLRIAADHDCSRPPRHNFSSCIKHPSSILYKIFWCVLTHDAVGDTLRARPVLQHDNARHWILWRSNDERATVFYRRCRLMIWSRGVVITEPRNRTKNFALSCGRPVSSTRTNRRIVSGIVSKKELPDCRRNCHAARGGDCRE